VGLNLIGGRWVAEGDHAEAVGEAAQRLAAGQLA
jgi:hypothetical protein